MLSISIAFVLLIALLIVPALAQQTASPKQVAAKIDGFLESHWIANKVQPAK